MDDKLTNIIKQYPQLKQINFKAQFNKLFFSRLISENVLVFLLQYIGLATLSFAPHSFLLFATGTACAFVFLRGMYILPGIWLGSIFAYSTLGTHLKVASTCATLLTLQAFFLLLCTQRYIAPTLIFYQRNIFIKFIFLSSILTAIISFMLVIVTDTFSVLTFLQHSAANFNGLIIVTIAIITWDFYFPEIDRKKLQRKSLILLYATLSILSFLLLCSQTVFFIILISILILLLSLIISMRFKWCGAVATHFLFAIFLTLGVECGAPLFITPFAKYTFEFFQGFLVCQTILGLLIAI